MVYTDVSTPQLKYRIKRHKRTIQLLTNSINDLETELAKRYKYAVVEVICEHTLVTIKLFNTRKVAQAFAAWLSRGALKELRIKTIPNA